MAFIAQHQYKKPPQPIPIQRKEQQPTKVYYFDLILLNNIILHSPMFMFHRQYKKFRNKNHRCQFHAAVQIQHFNFASIYFWTKMANDLKLVFILKCIKIQIKFSSPTIHIGILSITKSKKFHRGHMTMWIVLGHLH
jgi:hypothetical protein